MWAKTFVVTHVMNRAEKLLLLRQQHGLDGLAGGGQAVAVHIASCREDEGVSLGVAEELQAGGVREGGAIPVVPAPRHHRPLGRGHRAPAAAGLKDTGSITTRRQDATPAHVKGP